MSIWEVVPVNEPFSAPRQAVYCALAIEEDGC
jgi:hypothetical protein